MERLISRLRAAYALGNAQRLRTAARALMSYAAKHPMAAAMGEDRDAVLRLAARINAASERELVAVFVRQAQRGSW